MINYLLKFLQDYPNQLESYHKKEFHSNMIKKEIVKAPILAYSDPNKQMVLQTDTSINGLGACLMQQGSPVYFTSKALTKTKKGM